MTSKEYLQQLISMNDAIKEIDEKIAWIRSQAEYRGRVTSDLPKGIKMPKSIADFLADMDPLYTERDSLWDERISIAREAEGYISQIKDRRYRHVLRYRYIFGMQWPKVSEKMGYTEQHVFKLHGRALQKFDEVAKVDSECECQKML